MLVKGDVIYTSVWPGENVPQGCYCDSTPEATWSQRGKSSLEFSQPVCVTNTAAEELLCAGAIIYLQRWNVLSRAVKPDTHCCAWYSVLYTNEEAC